MPLLYELIDTNSINAENLSTKKVEVLFDLNNDKYEISDTSFTKKFICISGSCDVKFIKNNVSETVTLNEPNKTVQINKDIFTELTNYTKQTKIYVEYLADKGI